MELASTLETGWDRRRPARVVTLLAVAGLLFAASAANCHAQGIDAAAQAHAQRLAVSVCGACHGNHGHSEVPKFPRLAGQSSKYLAAQLRAFKNQTRGDPDAVGFMWGMAGNLEDSVIDALAEYYAAQSPSPGIAGDATRAARGREIYVSGTAKGVPACAGCHGPDAHGTADFPRLAGQHAQYLVKQLTSFRNNMRDVAVMHAVVQSLSQSEIAAIAEFLQAQP